MKTVKYNKVLASVPDHIQMNEAHIGNTRKMILENSRNMYSKPKEALMRELVSNVWDVHVEHQVLNKDGEIAPVHIEIPNFLNSEVVIRDQGPGLAPEEMRTLIFGVFESTKENSNTQIGKFGLGSLTPLSVSDTYQVVSIYYEKPSKENQFVGGYRKDIHQATLDDSEEGYSKFYNYISHSEYLGSSLPDGVTTGLEYRIPSSLSDSASWEVAIQKSLEFFPKSFVDFDIKRVENELIFEDKTMDARVEMYPSKRFYQMSSLICVQGNVGYSVPFPSNEFKNHSKHRIVLNFNIGQLPVTPSRESIAFDKGGVVESLINNKIKDFYELYLSKMQEILNKKKTLFEVFQFIKDNPSFEKNNLIWKIDDYKIKVSDFNGNWDFNNIDYVDGHSILNINSKYRTIIRAKIFNNGDKNSKYYYIKNDKNNTHIRNKKSIVGPFQSWDSSRALFTFRSQKEYEHFKKYFGDIFGGGNINDVSYTPTPPVKVKSKSNKSSNSKGYLRDLFNEILNDESFLDDFNPKEGFPSVCYLNWTVAKETRDPAENESLSYLQRMYESNNKSLKILYVPKSRLSEINQLKIPHFDDLVEQILVRKGQIKQNVYNITKKYKSISNDNYVLLILKRLGIISGITINVPSLHKDTTFIKYEIKSIDLEKLANDAVSKNPKYNIEYMLENNFEFWKFNDVLKSELYKFDKIKPIKIK